MHKNYINGKSVINETKSDGTIIDIENDGKNKTLRAVDFEGYIIEMKQYANGDKEITLFDSAGNRVDLKTARMVIRRMDLSIKAEDVNNLIEEKDSNESSENENSTNENSANETSEIDSEENYFDEYEEDSLNT